MDSWTDLDRVFMLAALDEAKLALNENEVPVGCVLVDKSEWQIIARGHNKVNVSCNPTRHAEFEAMDKLDYRVENRNIRLYVTCEPCCMCATALRFGKIYDVIYGCANDRFGGCGTVSPNSQLPMFEPHRANGELLFPFPSLEVRHGLFADKAVMLLQQFYKQDNLMAPPEKRKRKN